MAAQELIGGGKLRSNCGCLTAGRLGLRFHATQRSTRLLSPRVGLLTCLASILSLHLQLCHLQGRLLVLSLQTLDLPLELTLAFALYLREGALQCPHPVLARLLRCRRVG